MTEIERHTEPTGAAPPPPRPLVAGWDDEPPPSRPRRKLLTPTRGLLGALLIGVGGFLAGVVVEKGQMTSGASGARGGRFAGGGATALLGAQGPGPTGGAAASGRGAGGGGGPGLGSRLGGGAATIGSVSTVQGSTLYLTDLSGNTIRVLTNGGSQVSKTVASTVRAIHPGDTVIVSGSKATDGSVTAAQIRLTPAAAGGSGGGLGSLFGGGGGGGGSAGAGANGGGGGGGSLRGLFGG